MLGVFSVFCMFIESTFMSTPEHSHVLKHLRATHHLLNLYDATDDWFREGKHSRSWFEIAPDNPANVVLKASADPIPFEPFSLILSDAIHNMRSFHRQRHPTASGSSRPLPGSGRVWPTIPS